MGVSALNGYGKEGKELVSYMDTFKISKGLPICLRGLKGCRAKF